MAHSYVCGMTHAVWLVICNCQISSPTDKSLLNMWDPHPPFSARSHTHTHTMPQTPLLLPYTYTSPVRTQDFWRRYGEGHLTNKTLKGLRELKLASTYNDCEVGHVTHGNTWCHTCSEWVVCHAQLRNASCHACSEWGMSHVCCQMWHDAFPRVTWLHVYVLISDILYSSHVGTQDMNYLEKTPLKVT